MQQLQLFGKDDMELEAAERRDVAVSSETSRPPGPSRKLRRDHVPDADPGRPGLEHFKHSVHYDDFESQPLHGCFLIDAEGNVRYQRISSEPFLEVDFIKAEVGPGEWAA